MKFSVLLVVGAAIVIQAGCVTGRRTLNLPVTSSSTVSPSVRGSVYIASVTDDRKFQNKPSDPSVPSIDGDVTKISASQKDQMIGRQRNGFGHAMGDIGLPAGDSVTTKVRTLVEQGLRQNGYQVSADPNSPNSVAVSVNEFWAWMTPGFWSLTFEAKIMCVLTVNNGDGSARTTVVRGYGRNPGQFAKDVNWQDAYIPAFEDFIKNFDGEIEKVGLREPNSASSPPRGFQAYEDLKKLDDLKKEGIISEPEFEAQKKKILDRSYQ